MKTILTVLFFCMASSVFCMNMAPFKIYAKNMANIPIQFELRCDTVSLVSDNMGMLEISAERIRLYSGLKFQAVIKNIHAIQIYMRHLFNDVSTTSTYIHKDEITFEKLYSDIDRIFYFKPKDKKFIDN